MTSAFTSASQGRARFTQGAICILKCMFQFIYPAKIKKDGAGFFLVTFPDIPFAATDGKTMAEALEEARDCLEEAIAVSIAGLSFDDQRLTLAF